MEDNNMTATEAHAINNTICSQIQGPNIDAYQCKGIQGVTIKIIPDFGIHVVMKTFISQGISILGREFWPLCYVQTKDKNWIGHLWQKKS